MGALRVLAIGVAISLTAAACGGGGDTDDTAADDGPAPSSADLTGSPAEVNDALVDALSARHGPTGGARAVLLALERGYSARTVAESALAATLEEDGTALTADREVRAPSGQRAGVIELPEEPESAAGAAGAAARIRLAAAGGSGEVREVETLLGRLGATMARDRTVVTGLERETEGERVLGLILALFVAGYTLDQIVELLVLGVSPPGEGFHVNVRDGCGIMLGPDERIEPRGTAVLSACDENFGDAEPEPDPAPTEETADEPDPGAARIFAGTGTVTRVLTVTSDVGFGVGPVECLADVDMTLKLSPDGTLELLVTELIGHESPEANVWECSGPKPGQIHPGTWTADSFEVESIAPDTPPLVGSIGGGGAVLDGSWALENPGTLIQDGETVATLVTMELGYTFELAPAG